MNDQNNLPAFKKLIKENDHDGFIVTNPTNIFYLTGFKGVLPAERESILVFNLYSSKPWRSGATLITARIYLNEAQRVKNRDLKIKIVNERNQVLESVSKIFKMGSPTDLSSTALAKEEALAKVGFEANDLKFAEFKEFKKALGGAKLIPFKNLVEDLRVIKTQDEVKRIEKAQIISQKAFDILIKTIKIGQTEAEIADKLAQIIKSLGADGLAFESIVAVGKNAGLPHYFTGNTKIKRGQVLLFDFGARYQNYCSDLSRTIFIGKTSDRQRNIYHHVLTAQKAAIEKITHGIKASHIYHAANNIFKKHKLHPYFLHGLGHGVGLEIHEFPYLRPASPARSDSESRRAKRGEPTINDKLQENMVFSVEPGLYFPDFGVRIEDLVVIENGRAKVLGKLQEEIMEV